MIAFPGGSAEVDFHTLESDITDVVLGAGVRATGEMKVDRLVERNPPAKVLCKSDAVSLIGGGPFAARASGGQCELTGILGMDLDVGLGGIELAQDGGSSGAGIGMPLGAGAPTCEGTRGYCSSVASGVGLGCSKMKRASPSVVKKRPSEKRRRSLGG